MSRQKRVKAWKEFKMPMIDEEERDVWGGTGLKKGRKGRERS